MTEREALKLALKALQSDDYWTHVEAVNAIHKALAQPEQIPPSAYSNTHQPEHEPVALQMDVIVVNLVREGINKHRARELAEHFIKNTTPPQHVLMAQYWKDEYDNLKAQRTWVNATTWRGLTDEDIDGFVKQYWDDELTTMRSMMKDVEAKLKEKNT